MANRNNDKKKIWIYAVILFTSAFVVLLLTAISQIKLNKNINDYKTQIFTKEKEKSDFQLNLSSSMNLNKKLQEEIKKVKDSLNKEIDENEIEEEKYNELKTKFNETVNAYEKLILAEKEYESENYTACALILNKQCNIKFLNEDGAKRYIHLKENSYGRAAKKFFSEGLKDYKKGNYGLAIDKFQTSVDLMPYEFFSDDCYYYIAYSFFKNEDYDNSKSAIEKLLKNYSDSSYTDDAYDLLNIINRN